MTSSDTPDTGAGTPLTAEEEAEVRQRDRDVPWTAVLGTARWTDEAAWTAVDDRRRLLATLDAARSRPAPDPAGLDAIRALKWLADETAAHIAAADAPDSLLDAERHARYVLARLSVADGAGWRVHNHGADEGRGTACREYHLNGRLVGACLIAAALPEHREEPSR